VHLVGREGARIRARFGLDLSIECILVRDLAKERPGVDRALLTTSALDVLDADLDLIVEVIGGVHCAGTYVRRAIDRKRHVVTANKALLAAAGGELFGAAARRGVALARGHGCVIRQVAEASRVAGGVELVVEPRSVPAADPLARTIDEQNAVVIRGRAVGEIVLSGRGAGAMPTAAAVLSDVLAAARTITVV
jgi:homoserine dehydrogenase